MEKLIYSIADLSICIETPHPLEISEASDPFQLLEDADCDGQITLMPVDSLQANGRKWDMAPKSVLCRYRRG